VTRVRSAFALAALALMSVAVGASDNWPQWRGPDMAAVVADDPALPERWSATDNVAWKTPSVVAFQEGEKPRRRQRIEAGATFTSSPWAYNGKVFLLSEDGNTYVIEAGPKYRLIGKNVLDEMTLASPAVAGGRLLIRTSSNLYAIRGQK